MKLKRLFIVIIMLIFMGKVLADDSINGVPKSEYKNTIFSHNRVEISVLDENDKYIRDSKIQIQDKEGSIIYEFETTNDAFVIERLEEGIYYLVQVNVPSGYELNSNKIKFEVKDSVVNLELKNKKSIINKSSINASYTMLYFMAMLDITIGLGILGYVKSKKVKKIKK